MSKKRPIRHDNRQETTLNSTPEPTAVSLVPPASRTALIEAEPAHSEGEPGSGGLFDPVALAQEGTRFLIETLESRLERAVDALIDHRLDDPTDIEARRQILFDLYEADIVSKPDLRRRGALEPAEFHDEIRKYRVRQRQS